MLFYGAKERARDYKYFETHRTELFNRYGHKHIVIRNGTVLGAYDTTRKAVNETTKLFPIGSFLVQECTADISDTTQVLVSPPSVVAYKESLLPKEAVKTESVSNCTLKLPVTPSLNAHRKLLLITGESGAGKDCISDCLCAMYGWHKVKSYTTRKPRFKGEDTHIFVSKAEFNKLKDIVAYTNRNGIEYCATQKQVDESDIYVIDPPGIKYFFKQYKGSRLPVVVCLTTDKVTREQRVISRSKEGKRELKERAYESELFNDLKQFNPIIVKNNRAPMSVAAEVFSLVSALYISEQIC